MARSVNVFITAWTVPPNAINPFSLTARYVWIDDAGVSHDQTATVSSTLGLGPLFAGVVVDMQQLLLNRIRVQLGVDG